MANKIVFDCLGGDHGLPAMVGGAVLALKKYPELNLVLVGDQEQIAPQVAEFGARVEIIDTKENIAFDEHPTEAIRKKPNSSVVLGLEALKKREDCGAFLSAGSTGAVLTGGFLKVGRIPGVSRPAMCPDLPCSGGHFMLIDCGANMDSTPINLVHFALMGNVYKKAMGLASPRVALLNVGSESTKGNALTQGTYPLLMKLHEAGQINFIGNIEADHALKGEADIVVTDGFYGNVLLKTAEGMAKYLLKEIKGAMTSSLGAKIGALFLGGKVKKLKNEKMSGQAGSIFLGLKKPVIKMHGNATAPVVLSAIEYAMTVAGLNLEEKIVATLTSAETVLGSANA